MKITDLHIDGFGIFHEQSVADMAPGLTVFHGPNEAGKSTLLGFIRSLLFGFPRANAKEGLYAPLNGGRHGGHVKLLFEDGNRYTLSRTSGPGGGRIEITGPNGSTQDKGTLSQLLGGVSYEAFRNVYAFGLSELQNFESLKGESVAGAIYGAGFGDAMQALPTAKKKIRDQLNSLFKPSGSKPAMNQLVTRLERLEKTLLTTRREVARYDEIWHDLQKVEKQAATIQTALSKKRRHHHRYAAVVRLWPEWVTFQESEAALSELQRVPASFPDNGFEKMGSLLKRRERLMAAAEDIAGRQMKLQRQIASLNVDAAILDQAIRIAMLLEKRSEYVDSVRRRPLVQQDAHQLTVHITKALQSLGPDWTEDRVHGIDQSLFTREEIRKYGTSLMDLRKDITAAEHRLADRKKDLDQSIRVLAQAEKALVGLGPPPTDRDPSLILQVKQGRDRFEDAINEDGRLSQLRDQAAAVYAQLVSTREASTRGVLGSIRRALRSKWLIPVLVVGGLGAVGVIAFFLEGWVAPAIAGGGALLAVIGGLGCQRYQHKTDQYQNETIVRQQERIEELESQLVRIQSVLSDYSAVAARALGVSADDIHDARALLVKSDQLIAVLPDEQRLLDLHRGAQKDVAQKRAETNIADQHVADALLFQTQLQDRLTKVDTAWHEWLKKRGLPEILSPETAMEALDRIHRATTEMDRRNQRAKEMARLDEIIDAYRLLAKETFDAVTLPLPDHAQLPHAVGDLVSRLENAKAVSHGKNILEKQATALAWEQSENEKKVDANNRAVSALLMATGMADEAAFERTALALVERKRLSTQIRQCQKNIYRILGETDSAALREELALLSLTDARLRGDEAAAAVRAFEEKLTTLLSTRAALQQELEVLAGSDEMLRLRAKEAELTAELEDLAEEWARWSLAEKLLDHVTTSFEKKYQPHIVQDAGAFFSEMTGGRYAGLMAPIGDNTVLAVNKKGEHIAPDALSRGTAEQLYLAVRFGYVRHRAISGEALPVVMDDILVNFDPVRARHAAKAIQTLSESHQVLYFTCHPETVLLFKAVKDDLPIYCMKAGVLQKAGGGEV